MTTSLYSSNIKPPSLSPLLERQKVNIGVEAGHKPVATPIINYQQPFGGGAPAKGFIGNIFNMFFGGLVANFVKNFWNPFLFQIKQNLVVSFGVGMVTVASLHYLGFWGWVHGIFKNNSVVTEVSRSAEKAATKIVHKTLAKKFEGNSEAVELATSQANCVKALNELEEEARDNDAIKKKDAECDEINEKISALYLDLLEAEQKKTGGLSQQASVLIKKLGMSTFDKMLKGEMPEVGDAIDVLSGGTLVAGALKHEAIIAFLKSKVKGANAKEAIKAAGGIAADGAQKFENISSAAKQQAAGGGSYGGSKGEGAGGGTFKDSKMPDVSSNPADQSEEKDEEKDATKSHLTTPDRASYSGPSASQNRSLLHFSPLSDFTTDEGKTLRSHSFQKIANSTETKYRKTKDSKALLGDSFTLYKSEGEDEVSEKIWLSSHTFVNFPAFSSTNVVKRLTFCVISITDFGSKSAKDFGADLFKSIVLPKIESLAEQPAFDDSGNAVLKKMILIFNFPTESKNKESIVQSIRCLHADIEHFDVKEIFYLNTSNARFPFSKIGAVYFSLKQDSASGSDTIVSAEVSPAEAKYAQDVKDIQTKGELINCSNYFIGNDLVRINLHNFLEACYMGEDVGEYLADYSSL